MHAISKSPVFWLVLGILWSIVVLLHSVEKNLNSYWGLIFMGIWAASCYVIAIILAIKRKKQMSILHLKENSNEKSS